MTPSPFDESRAPGKWVGSNAKGLTALAEVVRKLGAEKGLPVVDFHAPMTAFNLAGQKRDPNFSICGRDRIHPELPGSMFMAFEFLKAQNVSPLVAEIHLDAARERDSGSQNADVSDIRAENGGLSFTVLEKALPLVVPAEAEAIAREIGMNRLNDEVLSVSGLKGGKYDLICDGETLGRYSEVTLAAGIDLASLTNAPGYRQAREVENRNERRCTFESIRLRKLACVRWFLRIRGVDPDDFAAVRKFYAKLSPDARKEYFESIIPRYLEDWLRRKELFAELDGLARAVDAVRRPTPHRWQVVPCAAR